MPKNKMTEQEEAKIFDAAFDRAQHDIGTNEEIASMSAKELVESISGSDRNSVKYRLYNYELKIRSIHEQHKLNEQILKKQHRLNLEALSKQQSFNKELSDNNNKTMVKAAVAGGVAGAIVAAIFSLVINATTPTNDTELKKPQMKTEKIK